MILLETRDNLKKIRDLVELTDEIPNDLLTTFRDEQGMIIELISDLTEATERLEFNDEKNSQRFNCQEVRKNYLHFNNNLNQDIHNIR